MNLDNFVVGTLLGSATLGYYALAFTWGTKLCETLGSVVNSVLFPTFAKIQGNVPRLRAAYIKSLEFVAFLAVGGYVALFVVSGDFLIHILGAGEDKWLPSIAVLQILCLYGLIRALLEPIGSVVMAVGGVPILVRANLLAAVVNMTLIYPALLAFGIEGVAAIVTVSYACQYLVFLPVLKDRLALSPREFMTPLSKPLIAGTITLAAMVAFQGADALGHGQLRFWLAGLSSVAIYIAVFGLLSRGTAYRDLYNLIRSRSTSA
jgi:O-antigen/teichoic acid export membrane protein